MSERVRHDRKRGRVEMGLEKELIERHDIGSAQRAGLRAQAHAVDLAEAAGAPELLSTANHVYLELLAAAGLSTGGARPVDAFDDILVRLARPSAGAGDIPND